ncbi:hypothetical protein [Sinosporangium siamense]|uniref:Uncharacterized protein n=1 Tax=Sinosporangium siamense TaxID=1367973 RepID=A0A919RMP8_9ACTN|nr:hypothetical protein [Sinosporangium siamense]GII95264.1 hypothetical protein Ssi02_54950 [Sinosporangium siamense]
MTDAFFDLSYAAGATLGGPAEVIRDAEASPYDVGFEMMLFHCFTLDAVREAGPEDYLG